MHTVADTSPATTAPPNVADQDQSYTFVVVSAAGDKLKGRVDVNIRLVEAAFVGSSIVPMPMTMKGTAEARGEAILKSVSATFIQ